MTELDIPFEKHELMQFLCGMESIDSRLKETLAAEELAAVTGCRELLQELIAGMLSGHHHHDHSHSHSHDHDHGHPHSHSHE
jgi:ABC-type nickel/cobalt efflux system permease component RcnA